MWCFFFKQKTAYEMRISDWSSDVCSSDLFDKKLRPGDRAATRDEALARSFRLLTALVKREVAAGCDGIGGTSDHEARIEVGVQGWLQIVRTLGDRKSTRLNSSH